MKQNDVDNQWQFRKKLHQELGHKYNGSCFGLFTFKAKCSEKVQYMTRTEDTLNDSSL